MQIQPRGGRTTVPRQVQLWNKLSLAGAGVLPLTIDSRTRLGQLRSAERAYTAAKKSGEELLNGFPLLAAAQDDLFLLMESANLPVSLRHGTPYASSLVRRALNIGIDEIEGGPISYLLPYSRDANIADVLKSWENVELDCVRFSRERKQPVVREFFGVLTACLVPPIQALISNLLEMMFCVVRGGESPMAGFGATGCAYQDVASIKAFRAVSKDLLLSEGFTGVSPRVAYHHWMGPFPRNKELASEIMAHGTQVAHFAGVEKIVTKTVEEAWGVPSDDANAEGVARTLNELRLLNKGHRLGKKLDIQKADIDDEARALEREALRILSQVKLKEAHINTELERVIFSGLVDVPFAPHKGNKKRLRTVRASDGSIRVSPDSVGPHSGDFIQREGSFLASSEWWNKRNSDEISLQIQWPGLSLADS